MSGLSRACRFAASMFSRVASIPTTSAPSRASGSQRSPPPHPTSSILSPCNGLRPAVDVFARVMFPRTAEMMNSTRTGFIRCSAENAPCGSHHLPESAANRLTSSGSTELDARVCACAHTLECAPAFIPIIDAAWVEWRMRRGLWQLDEQLLAT